MTWQGYQNTEVTLIDYSAEIFKTLNYLSKLLHSIRNPLGTRDNPARICKDLLNCEHRVSDGKFLLCSNSDVRFHHFSVFKIDSVFTSNCHRFDKTLVEAILVVFKKPNILRGRHNSEVRVSSSEGSH